MKKLIEFSAPESLRFIFFDIDDTLTSDGKLTALAYSALEKLSQKGFFLIPVTGRPAGWCEMIARLWPVSGVIGENGAFYFRYAGKKMKRHFAVAEKKRLNDQKTLKNKVLPKILKNVKGSALASDQFSRISDLAIDVCEDVKPLPEKSVQKIVGIFESFGATAKVSSIHVNGWFGKFDKLSMCKEFLKREFKITGAVVKNSAAFIGDSPNDEPMFEFFPMSFAVSNIMRFLDRLEHQPQYITQQPSGAGFSEFSEILLR